MRRIFSYSFIILLNASVHVCGQSRTAEAVSPNKTAASNPEGKGRTVRYDLHVRDTIVNFTGKRKKAIAINGSIPAPALYFEQGDTAEIYVHNEMKGLKSL